MSSETCPHPPGTALSPELLNFFQLSRTLVQPAPSPVLPKLPSLLRSPSLPAPWSRFSFFSASANPVCFSASLSL